MSASRSTKLYLSYTSRKRTEFNAGEINISLVAFRDFKDKFGMSETLFSDKKNLKLIPFFFPKTTFLTEETKHYILKKLLKNNWNSSFALIIVLL